MSALNGNKSRHHRERKQNIARRKRTREMIKQMAATGNSGKNRQAMSPKPVTE